MPEAGRATARCGGNPRRIRVSSFEHDAAQMVKDVRLAVEGQQRNTLGDAARGGPRGVDTCPAFAAIC